MNYLSRIWKKNSIPEDNPITAADDETRNYIDKLKQLNGMLSEKDEQICSIQEDYKKIFHLFSDMVILLDNAGSIIDLNKKAQKLLNEHNKYCQLIGQKWKDVMQNIGCNWDVSIEKEVIESDVLYEKTKEAYMDKLDKHFLISILPVRKSTDSDYFILVIRDITQIKERELNLIKKQKLLSYIDTIANIFSRNLNIDYIMDKIVETLSDIDKVDSVYIYKNCEHGMRAGKVREYYKNGHDINISDTIYYSEFPRWKDYFNLNQVICGTIEKFPKHEKEYLKNRDIKSICIVPIYTPLGFWGFIGFDSYDKTKYWSYDEEQLLKIAANVIGGEIYKWSLRNINSNIEDITVKCVNK